MLVLKAIGAPAGFPVGLMFIPVLALVLWNRTQEQDRFYGLGLPMLVFISLFSLVGFAEDMSGSVAENLNTVGRIAVCIALFWIMTLLLTLWGTPKRY